MPGEKWAGPAGSGGHQNEDGVSCVEQSGCVLQMVAERRDTSCLGSISAAVSFETPEWDWISLCRMTKDAIK